MRSDMRRKINWQAVLLLGFVSWQELRAQCPEIKYSKLEESLVSKEEQVFKVDSLEGNALYSMVQGSDMGRASDLCIALFAEKEGYQIALTRTGIKGEFAFYGQMPGQYRLIATSKAMTQLNILVELKEKPEADPEKQQRLLLHMRLKNNRGRSYASLISAKEYREREKL
jgi:hypothetical protein